MRLVASPAHNETFVRPGISSGYGARGWVLGAEVSVVRGSYYFSGGGAIGIEVATSAEDGQPWGRVYAEAEATFLAVGSGFGPAYLFGGANPRWEFQMTPYAVLPFWADSLGRQCAFPLVIPYYRFTTGEEKNLHEAGTFAKVVTNWECMMRDDF